MPLVFLSALLGLAGCTQDLPTTPTPITTPTGAGDGSTVVGPAWLCDEARLNNRTVWCTIVEEPVDE